MSSGPGASRMLVGSDDGGVDRDNPVAVAFGIGLGEQGGANLLAAVRLACGAVGELALVRPPLDGGHVLGAVGAAPDVRPVRPPLVGVRQGRVVEVDRVHRVVEGVPRGDGVGDRRPRERRGRSGWVPAVDLGGDPGGVLGARVADAVPATGLWAGALIFSAVRSLMVHRTEAVRRGLEAGRQAEAAVVAGAAARRTRLIRS